MAYYDSINKDTDADRKINEKFEKIEEKIRNSFKNIKEDMNSIKRGLSSIGDKDTGKEGKDYSKELERIRESIASIEIKRNELKETQNNSRELSKIKESIDRKFGELNSAINSIKIKETRETPAQRAELSEIKQNISGLRAEIATKNELRELRKEIERKAKETERVIEKKDEEIRELRNQISYMQRSINNLSRKREEKQPVNGKRQVASKKVNRNVLIILASIIIVILILAGIMFFVKPTIKAKYNYLDVVAKNLTGLPIDVFYKQNKLNFMLYGWEGKLNYNGKEDRIAGNNVTGWFFNSTININENKVSATKYINVELIPNNKSIISMVYNYTLFKNKPYFKVQFSADTKNNSKLGLSAYGISAKDYNIYLQNGTILKNDNNVTIVNDTTIRTGSTYNINNSNYEIFYNQNKSLAIIAYSPEAKYFSNSFYWNVYWVYVNGTNGKYSPLYFIVLENANLTYVDGNWQVSSKYFTGDLNQYINKSVSAMS